MSQPNFLIIMTDQHRIDSIGAYGSAICKTPGLDKFDETATRFDNAYSVCALCTPARASVYTGLYPHKHGLLRNEIEFADDVRLISQDFRDAGYQCGFVGKWHCGAEKLPKDYGFDGMNIPGYGHGASTPEYKEYLQRNNLQQGEIIPTGLGRWNNVLLSGKITGSEEASTPYFLAEQTIDTLKGYQDSDGPFLLFTNFWGPHAPYLPTEPYASMYNPDDIPPWENFEDTLEGKPNAHSRYRDSLLGEGADARDWDTWKNWVATYYGFVTMIDAQIGRIFESLEQMGLDENTVVIFSCDHGEHCGAHGGIHDKSSMMYQETYHIPLMVRVPGMETVNINDKPITNMDILPTCLGLAGIDVDRSLDGRSLVPLLQNDTAEWDDTAYCMFNGHHYLYEARMITDGRYKYVFNAPEIDELYDLENDPWEMDNLASQDAYQTKIDEMRQLLMDWAVRTDDPLLEWIRNLFVKRDSNQLENYTPYRT
jgi:arylsulfatase A-like enzyme